MSVKDRVNSLVADTRQSFTQTPILEANSVTPQSRIGGITYTELADGMTAIAVATIENGGKLAKTNGQKLLDALFLSPRLTQWEKTTYTNGYAQWIIYAKDDSVFVVVSNNIRMEKEGEFEISLHKGKRDWDVTKGLPAQSLWQALEQAQPIVQVADAEPMTDAEQESYFHEEDDDDYYAGATLDAALVDTPEKTTLDDDDDEDAALIGDVTGADDALNADQHDLDGPDPVVTVTQAFIDDISAPDPNAKKHTNRTAGLVEAEVERVKQEYPELNASPVPLGTRSEMTRIKSLQGRILTVMDAAIADKDQRAAVKTLINKEFRHTLTMLDRPAVVKGE
jgi:hypothetical protein